MIGRCAECRATDVGVYEVIADGETKKCLCPKCANKLGYMRGVEMLDEMFERKDTIRDRIDRFFGKMGKHMRGYK